MTTYYIKSNYKNHFYRILETGEVIQTENGKMQPSAHWKITGAWYKKPFGHYEGIDLKTLLTFAENGREDFRYKNGNPKMGLTDIDHGTHRDHGNINVHGIAYILKEE